MIALAFSNATPGIDNAAPPQQTYHPHSRPPPSIALNDLISATPLSLTLALGLVGVAAGLLATGCI